MILLPFCSEAHSLWSGCSLKAVFLNKNYFFSECCTDFLWGCLVLFFVICPWGLEGPYKYKCIIRSIISWIVASRNFTHNKQILNVWTCSIDFFKWFQTSCKRTCCPCHMITCIRVFQERLFSKIVRKLTNKNNSRVHSLSVNWLFCQVNFIHILALPHLNEKKNQECMNRNFQVL